MKILLVIKVLKKLWENSMFKLANDILNVMESTWPIVAVTVMAMYLLELLTMLKQKRNLFYMKNY